MKKWIIPSIVVLLVLFAGIYFSPKASSQEVIPELRLQRSGLTGESVAAGLETAVANLTILQFRGPITANDRQALEKTGITILEYIPQYAYLVRGTPEQLSTASRLPQLYSQTPFLLADKLSPAFQQSLAEGNKEIGLVHITGWPDQKEQLLNDLSALPFNPTESLTADQLLQVIALDSVRWVEHTSHPMLLNDLARGIMGVTTVWQNRQLFGTGQTVAVTDSGLDTGDFNTLSPDFAGRIAATFILVPGANWDDFNGHGTHVTGSIAGAGVQSGANPALHNYNGSFAGVAPEANLVIQSMEVDANGATTGLPEDYYDLFLQAYNAGARIHSDSWGDYTGPVNTSSQYGAYPYGSQRTDAFMWDYPDMAIFFAAGNSGKDGTPGAFGFCTGGNGIVDPDSLLTPGTAKNVITVAASEMNRNSGPVQGYPWFLINPCLGTQPIASDLVANTFNGMAGFSSRGPTDDGRIKPDITSPGVNIISNRSHVPDAGTLWGPYNDHYSYSAGTSMATPLTSGSGALVRQWLQLQGATTPSSALIKGVLLNTTTDIAPGQYGTGTTQEIPYARPNSVSGWGRTNVGFMDPAPYYKLWFDDHSTGLNTGNSVSYSHTTSQPLTVLNNSLPLRVMIVWTDPPASLSAQTQLVNDLDLVVTGPSGELYYGNNNATGDRLNNVEGIVINNPPVGEYHITVSAFNVPMASQPYALVVGGPLVEYVPPTATPTVTATFTPSPTSTNTPSPTPTLTPSPTNTPTQTWTPSPTPTFTPTPTATPTFTPTPTPTATAVPLCSGGYNAKVNFQPATSSLPFDYMLDNGTLFGVHVNGCAYGWDMPVTVEDRRNTHPTAVAPDGRYYTSALMQPNGVNAKWEMEVPNGTYLVSLVAGDPLYFSAGDASEPPMALKIAVEGMAWAGGSTTSNQRWVSGSGVVVVNDGRLTVTNDTGAVKNRINFIEITRIGELPTGFRTKVNFQPLFSPSPSSYLVDSGNLYGLQGNGYAYGWNVSNTGNSADRNSTESLDQRYDTLILMQNKGTFTWEMAVPNGKYAVYLVAGDPIAVDSTYKIAVEGVLTINGSPLSTLHALAESVIVTVSDGRLTVSNASGAINNKIDFIEIIQIAP